MSMKWAASMRVLRLNSLEHFLNIPRYVQDRNDLNRKHELCSKRSYVNSIVMVYTNS